MKKAFFACLAVHLFLCLLGGAAFVLMLLLTDGWLFGLPVSPAWMLLLLPLALLSYGAGRLLRRKAALPHRACRRAALGFCTVSLALLSLLFFARDTAVLYLNLWNLPFLAPLTALCGALPDSLPPAPFALFFAAVEPAFLTLGLRTAPHSIHDEGEFTPCVK